MTSALTGADVDEAVAEMVRTLHPHVDRDWTVPAGSLTWTCRETAAHVAHDLLAYAGQVAGHPDEAYLPMDLVIPDAATPHEVLKVVSAVGRLLRSAVDTAGPEARGWHWEPTDPGGFAALGVNELLVHTYDITQGLRLPWRPPGSLCAAVLGRLFPDSPAGEPSEVLLWSTGRAELAGRPRLTSWTLKAAAQVGDDNRHVEPPERPTR
jgi:hypothetical protein